MTELVLRLQYSYLCKLIDRIYKIIPLKEECSDSIETYVDGLIAEILGNSELINSIDYDARVMIIVSTLRSVVKCDEHSKYRKNVFKCIRYIEQLKDTVSEELSKCVNNGKFMTNS